MGEHAETTDVWEREDGAQHGAGEAEHDEEGREIADQDVLHHVHEEEARLAQVVDG